MQLWLVVAILGLDLRRTLGHPINSSEEEVEEEIDDEMTVEFSSSTTSSNSIRDDEKLNSSSSSQNSPDVNNISNGRFNRTTGKKFDPVWYLSKYGYLGSTSQHKRGSLVMYQPG